MKRERRSFDKEIIKGINPKGNRFGFESDVIAKIFRIVTIRNYEVGISY
jgi:hypothetical protein